MKFRTRAIHVGNEHDSATGAVVPPLYLASTFVQAAAGVPQEYDYARSGSPTRKNFETTLANLEGGTHALAFATGMAATTCVTMMLSSGDHIVAGRDIYGGSYRLLHNVMNRFGIEVTLVNTSGDLAEVKAAITPRTKLLWIETPGNPLMSITDIAAATVTPETPPTAIESPPGSVMANGNDMLVPTSSSPSKAAMVRSSSTSSRSSASPSSVPLGSPKPRASASWNRWCSSGVMARRTMGIGSF